MSVKLMSMVFDAVLPDIQINSGHTVSQATIKLVLLAMADHGHDDGESIYPSYQRLSLKTGLSRRTIINAIEAAVGMGIIKAIGRGQYDTIHYIFQIDRLAEFDVWEIPKKGRPPEKTSEPSSPIIKTSESGTYIGELGSKTSESGTYIGEPDSPESLFNHLNHQRNNEFQKFFESILIQKFSDIRNTAVARRKLDQVAIMGTNEKKLYLTSPPGEAEWLQQRTAKTLLNYFSALGILEIEFVEVNHGT